MRLPYFTLGLGLMILGLYFLPGSPKVEDRILPMAAGGVASLMFAAAFYPSSP
jgi:hypothetical protein